MPAEVPEEPAKYLLQCAYLKDQHSLAAFARQGECIAITTCIPNCPDVDASTARKVHAISVIVFLRFLR